MIRKIRTVENWDGYDRRYGPPTRRTYIDDDYIQEQVIVKQEPTEKKPQWLSAGTLVPILYAIVSGAFLWTWHVNERVTALEYKQQTLFEKHGDHVKTDDEFKQIINQLDRKVDGIQEHIRSVEETMMQMYSSINNHTRLK